MKIIKPGILTKNKEILLTGECTICDCEIECSPHDRGVMGAWYSNDIYRIPCPECSTMMTLREKE